MRAERDSGALALALFCAAVAVLIGVLWLATGCDETDVFEAAEPVIVTTPLPPNCRWVVDWTKPIGQRRQIVCQRPDDDEDDEAGE